MGTECLWGFLMLLPSQAQEQITKGLRAKEARSERVPSGRGGGAAEWSWAWYCSSSLLPEAWALQPRCASPQVPALLCSCTCALEVCHSAGDSLRAGSSS